MAAISSAASSPLLQRQFSQPKKTLFATPLLRTSRSPSSFNPLVPLLRSPLPRRSPPLSAIEFEELVEKDWSFLENPTDPSSKFDRMISAADVGANSRVLACFPTAEFIDYLVKTRPSELLIATHDSLFLLAEIKERHDSVRCWQGGVDAVPERLFPLTSALVCYFPAMKVSVDQLLKNLARCCSPGARVVIASVHGREGVRLHREEYPDMVTSDLPERSSVEQAAEKNSFRVLEFVDESSFYLSVLELSAAASPS